MAETTEAFVRKMKSVATFAPSGTRGAGYPPQLIVITQEDRRQSRFKCGCIRRLKSGHQKSHEAVGDILACRATVNRLRHLTFER